MFQILINKLKESYILTPLWTALEPFSQALTAAQQKIHTFKDSLMPSPTFYHKYATNSQTIISHCLTLEQAILMASEYRLPLVEIRVSNEAE